MQVQVQKTQVRKYFTDGLAFLAWDHDAQRPHVCHEEVHDLGELIFIGLGLHDGEDISVKGLKVVRAAGEVFAEFYTARLTGTDLKELEKALGRKFKVLTRQEVEDGSILLEAAKKGTVALLCVGDPMSATTHVDLRLRAQQCGIKTRIIHGASIMTGAASLLGLQH
jgi:diphthine synthase